MSIPKHNIEDIKLLLPDYVMKRLSSKENSIVKNVIEGSPELKSLHDEIADAIVFVNTVKRVEPGPGYWTSLLPKIHSRIEKLEEKRFSLEKIVSYWKVAVPVAAVILIAIIYFTVINKQPGPTITEDKKELKKTDSVKEDLNNEIQKNEIAKDKEQIEKPENITEVKQRRKLNLSEEQFTTVGEEQIQKKEEQDNGEDIASENLEELVRSTGKVFDPLSDESAFIGGAGGFDDETEDELNRLSDNEQEILIKELKNSNL